MLSVKEMYKLTYKEFPKGMEWESQKTNRMNEQLLSANKKKPKPSIMFYSAKLRKSRGGVLLIAIRKLENNNKPTHDLVLCHHFAKGRQCTFQVEASHCNSWYIVEALTLRLQSHPHRGAYELLFPASGHF